MGTFAHSGLCKLIFVVFVAALRFEEVTEDASTGIVRNVSHSKLKVGGGENGRIAYRTTAPTRPPATMPMTAPVEGESSLSAEEELDAEAELDPVM